MIFKIHKIEIFNERKKSTLYIIHHHINFDTVIPLNLRY
jgi:hypothetical protein